MTTDTTDPFNQILDAPFDSALSDRYLVYALSTTSSWTDDSTEPGVLA